MKLIKFTLIFFMLFFISCNKNNDTFNGTLDISFSEDYSFIKISIYSIHNLEYPIYNNEFVRNGNSFNLPLNVGDYIVKPNSSSAYFSKVAFQIMNNKTTKIEYDRSGQGKVVRVK